MCKFLHSSEEKARKGLYIAKCMPVKVYVLNLVEGSLGFPTKVTKFSIRLLMYGAHVMSSSVVNSYHYYIINIITAVRSALDREIQELSFVFWVAVEIL